MNRKEFKEIIESRLEFCRILLESKGNEYIPEYANSPIHNFIEGAKIKGTTKSDYLLGLFIKHFVSIKDIVDKYKFTKELSSNELIAEKITDAINYLLILECILEEERK